MLNCSPLTAYAVTVTGGLAAAATSPRVAELPNVTWILAVCKEPERKSTTDAFSARPVSTEQVLPGTSSSQAQKYKTCFTYRAKLKNRAARTLSHFQRGRAYLRHVHAASFVNPDIIDHHLCRTRRRAVRRSRPVASNRQIQQKIEWRIEHPAPARRHISCGANKKRLSPIVHIKLHHRRRPYRAINMTSRRRIIDALPAWKRQYFRKTKPPFLRGARPVNRRFNFIRSESRCGIRPTLEYFP